MEKYKPAPSNKTEENIDDIYLMEWKNGTQILAKFDTDYESDNNLVIEIDFPEDIELEDWRAKCLA